LFELKISEYIRVPQLPDLIKTARFHALRGNVRPDATSGNERDGGKLTA